MRDKQLAVAIIAGKHFTTRRHLAVLTTCKLIEVQASEADLPPARKEVLTTEQARQLLETELCSERFPRNSRRH